MEKKYCKLRSHKGTPDHLITKQMCIDWGMRPVDHVFDGNGTFKGTTGNVYQHHGNHAPEIRFGPAYSSVGVDQCAGVWGWAL